MGQDAAIQLERVYHLERPAALDYIEQGGAGGVRNIACEFSGELEAHVILRQQHLLITLKIPWLVVAHPEELGQREAGEHWIRGVAQYGIFADSVIYPIRLRL